MKIMARVFPLTRKKKFSHATPGPQKGLLFISW
jgi:hypothetical protein